MFAPWEMTKLRALFSWNYTCLTLGLGLGHWLWKVPKHCPTRTNETYQRGKFAEPETHESGQGAHQEQRVRQTHAGTCDPADALQLMSLLHGTF
ncbi:hypothetical protein QBC33DRAFT_528791 [Phialemonium atrogriseum]|uniref:Uncharacterized protein n=1 Tax=Phialemonium atrogriseum TaxID=1093897 RepID=A0AAJ0C8K5_9PEZI|nr:uncharacterized protein QBC33DRAFT_528791 [Phialemonium atrogriseum]KAK1770644.1 hypothetical protein QBC33DRAFT_528791 [Phialemonium atrogriseum]